MQAQKYSVNQHLIETLLVWVKSGEIAIPEIQRPKLTDDEAKQFLETLEKYCELVINYTLKNRGDEEEKLERL